MQQNMYGLEQLTSLTDLLLDSNPPKKLSKGPEIFSSTSSSGFGIYLYF